MLHQHQRVFGSGHAKHAGRPLCSRARYAERLRQPQQQGTTHARQHGCGGDGGWDSSDQCLATHMHMPCRLSSIYAVAKSSSYPASQVRGREALAGRELTVLGACQWIGALLTANCNKMIGVSFGYITSQFRLWQALAGRQVLLDWCTGRPAAASVSEWLALVVQQSAALCGLT